MSRTVVALLVAVGALAACEAEKSPAMPNVTGKKLDIAQSDIKRAGFDKKIEVDGGGLLGVVKESNWEVCEQTPSPGAPLTETPRLKVERDCGKGQGESTSTQSPERPEATSKASDDSRVLTVENNAELAALLRGPARGKTVEAFSEKYRVRLVQFDGFVADVYINPREHNGASTIDVMAGDADDAKHTGPVFQLSWYAHKSPLEKFAKGDNVRVTALLGMVYEFEPHQFYLVEDEGTPGLMPR